MNLLNRKEQLHTLNNLLWFDFDKQFVNVVIEPLFIKAKHVSSLGI